METVALDMLEHFHSGNGSPYSNSQLTSKVEASSEFNEWSNSVINTYIQNLRNSGNDIGSSSNFDLPGLSFDGIANGLGGLGITLHNVWETKAYLTNLKYNSASNTYSGMIRYEFKDDFGLDKVDVQSNLNRDIPPGAPSAFKAWYILQHYRCSKAFQTNMVIVKTF